MKRNGRQEWGTGSTTRRKRHTPVCPSLEVRGRRLIEESWKELEEKLKAMMEEVITEMGLALFGVRSFVLPQDNADTRS